ncbi:AAA family ATPase [Williamsoniiplasma lucivorax]|uniref:Primosomal protein DnaI n=1 Tax=Williamsoniiplasma lucivorax TaxID=209274 RepID=A0A2S5RFP0_9MOLU|nr:AAA family ATPase [Williamsoniiplasma lucivorax]PPE06144.1 primosomal protein DnaI [Williamsoniiplasma lucivorax]
MKHLKTLMDQVALNSELKSLIASLKNMFIKEGKTEDDAKLIVQKIIDNNQIVLEDFLTHFKICTKAPMTECEQSNPGYQTFITYENGFFYIRTKHCAHWFFDNKNEELKKHYLYSDFDIDSFSLSAKEYIDQLSGDADIFNENEQKIRKQFLDSAITKIKTNKHKGFFLTGEPGVGKTTLLKVLANGIASLKSEFMTVSFINVAHLMSQVKGSSFNEKRIETQKKLFDKLKYADVLFLDDIGSEVPSSWSRDDILLNLLNFRMENKKITFFSSNFSIKEIHKHYFLKNQDMTVEQVKQKRFMERIQALSEEFVLPGKSKRS